MAQKKELDSELNLIAFISLLSVLICSLLLTAIWIQIGSMNVKQAMGGQSTADKKVPAVWVVLDSIGNLSMELQDASSRTQKLAKAQIAGVDGKVNVEQLLIHINKIKKWVPELRTVLIKPKAEAVYEEMIQVMDSFKKAGLIDLGVAPL